MSVPAQNVRWRSDLGAGCASRPDTCCTCTTRLLWTSLCKRKSFSQFLVAWAIVTRTIGAVHKYGFLVWLFESQATVEQISRRRQVKRPLHHFVITLPVRGPSRQAGQAPRGTFIIAISTIGPNRFARNPAHLNVDSWLAAKHGVTIGDPLRRRVRTLSSEIRVLLGGSGWVKGPSEAATWCVCVPYVVGRQLTCPESVDSLRDSTVAVHL